MVMEAWKDICEHHLKKSASSIQPEAAGLLEDYLRVKELMICPASGTTRLKEIMQLPDTFPEWSENFLKK